MQDWRVLWQGHALDACRRRGGTPAGIAHVEALRGWQGYQQTIRREELCARVVASTCLRMRMPMATRHTNCDAPRASHRLRLVTHHRCNPFIPLLCGACIVQGAAAIGFFNSVSVIAEEEGHHPDLHLTSWRDVRVDLSTHAIGGLSLPDLVLAAKIDAIEARAS